MIPILPTLVGRQSKALKEGVALFRTMRIAGQRATRSPDDTLKITALQRARKDFEEWLSKHPEFRDVPEIADDLALFRLLDELFDEGKIQQMLAEVAMRMAKLPPGSPAAKAWRRIQATIGNNPNDWTRLLMRCLDHPDRLAEAARNLEWAKRASNVAKATKSRRVSRARGWKFAIRGELGECFFSMWPTWRWEVRHQMTKAKRAINKLPAGKDEYWDIVHLQDNVLLDGRKIWDESIVFVKRRRLTNGDEVPVDAVPFATAQVKIEGAGKYSAIEQSAIKDSRRESGGGTLSIWTKRGLEDFTLKAATTHKVVRYAVGAKGATVALGKQEQIAADGIDHFLELSLTPEQFDGVAEALLRALDQILKAA